MLNSCDEGETNHDVDCDQLGDTKVEHGPNYSTPTNQSKHGQLLVAICVLYGVLPTLSTPHFTAKAYTFAVVAVGLAQPTNIHIALTGSELVEGIGVGFVVLFVWLSST